MRDDACERIVVREFSFNGINFDEEDRRRSDFSAAEVAEVLRRTLDGHDNQAEGIKDQIEYFRRHIYIGEKNFRIVFSICKNTETIKLITLFRTSRKENEEA